MTMGKDPVPVARAHGSRPEVPPGYRFIPTDLELVNHYLKEKVMGCKVLPQVFHDIDSRELYSKPPSNLVSVVGGEREWYFFTLYDAKESHTPSKEIEEYYNDQTRIVGDGIGFWRVHIGTKESIRDDNGNVLAWKIQSTYYSGSTLNGKRTHWRMDEYQLSQQPTTNKKTEAETSQSQSVELVLLKLVRGKDYEKSASWP